MTKMNERNAQLKSALGAIAPKERIVESRSLPKEDTVNRQGHVAYSLSDKLRLVTMLNTLKLQPQCYRSENEQMRDLRDLIEKIGMTEPYFVCQAIVWSRCLGEGMRTINHLAAALVSPFISGQEYAKRFYSSFDKKSKSGGCIYRMDDMSEIKDAYEALTGKPLSNAMRKGFAMVLENADTYQLAKYSKTAIDIANLSHPKYKLAGATVTINGEKMATLDALMRGFNVAADTWEVAQSEAGQEVAKAVKEGKLSKAEAETVLAEAKADNWEALLKDGKLGIMAALRNIRNIMKNPRKDMVDMWCKLITDPEKIKRGLLLPIHFDLAYEVLTSEFPNVDYSPKVQQALLDAYEASIPNLKEALPGKTCVIVDCSGSMGVGVNINGKQLASSSGWGYYSRPTNGHTSCSYKAGLIAATVAKATGADVVRFGNRAQRFTYSKHINIFSLAREIGKADMGGTDLASAFDLINIERRAYDRIIIISDNEINGRVTSRAYSQYIHDVCSPYIYAVDLAAYGTTPIKNDGKVSYMFGYGSTLFDAIANQEFNPEACMAEIEKIVI